MEFMTPAEYAGLMGVDVQTVRRRCASGDIGAVKVGAAWRIPAPGAHSSEVEELRAEVESLKQWKEEVCAIFAQMP